MVTLSPVTTSTVNVIQPREQISSAREENASKERLATTKPFGTAAAKSETGSERKNDNQAFKLSESRIPDPSSTQGNRRGSLLDLSV